MARAWRQRFSRFLTKLRVETQGQYSTERLLALSTYSQATSLPRHILILLTTPLSCLIPTLLLELIPLAPPGEGARVNWALHIRALGVMLALSFLLFYQFAHYLPSLPSSIRQNVLQAVVVAVVTVAIDYALGYYVGFPVPFSLVSLSPIWITAVFTVMGIVWGRVVRERYQELRKPIANAFSVWQCQVGLVSIYPVYYLGYSVLSHTGRVLLMLSLPLIKLVLRVWFNNTVVHMRDEMPEVVVANVEVFTSLFMMYCMQITPSLLTTACLMALDFAQSAMSLMDVNAFVKEAKRLEEQRSSPYNHRENELLAQVVAIIEREGPNYSGLSGQSSDSSDRSALPRQHKSLESTQRELVSFAVLPDIPRRPSGAMNVRVMPTPRREPSAPPQPLRLTDQRFVDVVQKVLYVSEFLLLLSYVEATVPIIYGVYLWAVYYLPNRAYLPHIDSMTPADLYSTLSNLFLYATLELASLTLLHTVLKHRFRLPGLAQLAFVLENQWGGVQMKFLFFVLYNAQPPLQHFGFDYSFQFAWLHEPQNSTTTAT